MLSHKRISLLLAATFVASLLAVIATTLSRGQTTVPATRKITVLRRKDQLNLKPTSAEVASLRKQLPNEERQLEDTMPTHVPIRIKIRAEKEKAFKDLNNEHWVRDLEIEVKNTGTKPIYFLHLQLHLETTGPDGNGVGFVLLYGRTDLVEVTAPLKPEDVPIRPGETHIFTIAERYVRGLERIVREDNVRQPKKVRVIFQNINFGDGTGFWGTTAAPLPHPKRAANSVGPCTTDPKSGHKKDPTVNWLLVALNSSVRSSWFQGMPAVLPANFCPLNHRAPSPLRRAWSLILAVPERHVPGPSKVSRAVTVRPSTIQQYKISPMLNFQAVASREARARLLAIKQIGATSRIATAQPSGLLVHLLLSSPARVQIQRRRRVQVPALRRRHRVTQTVLTSSITQIADAGRSETEPTTGFAAARTDLHRPITQVSSPAQAVVIPLKLRTMVVTVASASSRTIPAVLGVSGALRIASAWTSSVHHVPQRHPRLVLVAGAAAVAAAQNTFGSVTKIWARAGKRSGALVRDAGENG